LKLNLYQPGLGQGLRRLSTFIGLIFGPAWAGSTIKYPHVYISVPVALLLLNMVKINLNFKRTHFTRPLL